MVTIKFLDYNMNLNFRDLSVDDAESRGLRAFGLGQRYDEVSRIRIIRPLDIVPRRLSRPKRVRVKNRDEILTGVSEIA